MLKAVFQSLVFVALSSAAICVGPNGASGLLVNLGDPKSRMPIAILAPDGKAFRVLPMQADIETDPCWLPDGSILFATLDFSQKKSTISQQRSDGSARRSIIEFKDRVAFGPTVSPREKTVLFWTLSAEPTGDHRVLQIYAMGLNGGGLRAFGPDRSWFPRWSPDGSKVAFIRGKDPSKTNSNETETTLNLMNAEGDEVQILTHFPGSFSSLAWSPDGEKLAVEGKDQKTGYSHIFLVNQDGANFKQLTSEKTFDSSPEFSTDGNSLVFVRQSESNPSTVHILDLATESSRLLTTDFSSGYLVNGGSQLLWMIQWLGPPPR